MASPRKRNRITGQFAARPIEMLEGPAYQVLSRAAHQVLARIEIEHAHHGGTDNGHLPVTYEQFVEYGLHRKAVPPAIRELEALGFIEVTQRGCGGNADFRRPSHYRLTYRHAKGETGDGTHEYRQFKDMDLAEMEAMARHARQNTDSRAREIARARIQKQNPGVGFRRASGSVSGPEMTQVSGSVSGPTSPGSISTPTSISREEASVCQSGEATSKHQPICSHSDGSTLAGEPGGRAADLTRATPGSEPADRPASPAGCLSPGPDDTETPFDRSTSYPRTCDLVRSPYRNCHLAGLPAHGP